LVWRLCLERGAIALKPSQNEHVRLRLESAAIKNFEIRFETRTASAPDTKTYSDVDEERQIVGTRGGTLSVLRNQPRSVAGLAGKEIWISASVPGETPTLRLTWHYPGAGGDATRPSVNVVGSAPRENQAELERAWDFVLQSLRPLPVR